MKLRNKKTGEIIAYGDISVGTRGTQGHHPFEAYSSLSKLNEDWEDYEPVEPIFDEKIRRGIRAWWDMQDNPFKNAAVLLRNKCKDRDGFYHWRIFGYIRNGEEKTSTDMEFRTKKLYGYNPSHDYTREELCGEEEE